MAYCPKLAHLTVLRPSTVNIDILLTAKWWDFMDTKWVHTVTIFLTVRLTSMSDKWLDTATVFLTLKWT